MKAQTFVDCFALRGGFVSWGAAAAADAVAEPWHFRIIWLLFCYIDRLPLGKKYNQQPLFTSQFPHMTNPNLTASVEQLQLFLSGIKVSGLFVCFWLQPGLHQSILGVSKHGACPNLCIIKTPPRIISLHLSTHASPTVPLGKMKESCLRQCAQHLQVLLYSCDFLFIISDYKFLAASC